MTESAPSVFPWKPPGHCDDSGAPGEPSQLEPELRGLGAGVRQDDMVEARRRDGREGFGSLRELRGKEEPCRECVRVELAPHHIDDGRVPVPEKKDAVPPAIQVWGVVFVVHARTQGPDFQWRAEDLGDRGERGADMRPVPSENCCPVSTLTDTRPHHLIRAHATARATRPC